jgi:PAS domain S-box-containing protein
MTYIGIYLLWDFGLLREITEIYSPGDVFFLIITWIISTAFIAVVLSTALYALQRQAALTHESEKRYELVMEATNDGIFDWDLNKDEFYVNDQYLKMLGYAVDELPHTYSTFISLLHPDDMDKVQESTKILLGGTRQVGSVELRFKSKSGDWKWILSRGKAVEFDESGFPTRVVGTIVDIDERKKTEQALQASELMLNKTGEIAKVGGWEIDFENDKVYITEVTKHILETPEDYIPNLEEALSFYTPEYQQTAADAVQKMQEEGINYDLEVEVDTYKGNRKWVRVIGIPERKGDGAIRIWGTYQDITDLKEAREKLEEYSKKLEAMVEERTEKLAESEQRYRRLSDASQEAIFFYNEDGVVEINQAFTDLFGYEKAEVLGQDGLIFTADESKDFVRAQTQSRTSDDFEIVMQKKDGTKFPAWVVGRNLPFDGKMYRVVTVRDLTERREMQKQLLRAERLATLGKLAGSVGHELRNPLGAIRNAAYYLNLVAESDQPNVHETLEIISEEIDQANRIVKDLMDFTRAWSPSYEQVNINLYLTDFVYRQNHQNGITIETRFGRNIPIIHADTKQLEQIFEKVTHNAVQSMPNGGMLIIKTEMLGDGQIIISFQDTGVGIPENHYEKIFEPLFTTKARGIGLGLPLVKTLVEGHQGSVEVKSKVGDGSTFTIVLPIRGNGRSSTTV